MDDSAFSLRPVDATRMERTYLVGIAEYAYHGFDCIIKTGTLITRIMWIARISWKVGVIKIILQVFRANN